MAFSLVGDKVSGKPGFPLPGSTWGLQLSRRFLHSIFIVCMKINIPDTCTSAHIKTNTASFISMIRHSDKSARVSVFIFIGRVCTSEGFVEVTLSLHPFHFNMIVDRKYVTSVPPNLICSTWPLGRRMPGVYEAPLL